MVTFVKCLLVCYCKYKEIVYPMYRYLGMGATLEAIYIQDSHITCGDLVKQRALILISYKGLAGDSCRQTHTNRRLLPRVLSSIYSAKVSHALHLIASIPLIQWREKCLSREEKSASPQWFFSIYVRSLKDQARQSKYPRTQILDPRTQPKLICHSSTTFIPTQSNGLNSGVRYEALLLAVHSSSATSRKQQCFAHGAVVECSAQCSAMNLYRLLLIIVVSLQPIR